MDRKEAIVTLIRMKADLSKDIKRLQLNRFFTWEDMQNERVLLTEHKDAVEFAITMLREGE